MWTYETLRNGVEHAIANLQTDFYQKNGIEDITQIDTELNKNLDEAIDKVASCLWKQLELERNPISTHYCEADDMTFIMQDSYDDNGNLVKQACIGWYYGKPEANLTKRYTCDLVAEYDFSDHRLRGAER